MTKNTKNNEIGLGDKLISMSEKYSTEYLVDKLAVYLKVLKKLGLSLLAYGVLSAIFLGIYDAWGFERTLILLAISLIFWGIKQNFINLKRTIILEQIIKDERKRRSDH